MNKLNEKLGAQQETKNCIKGVGEGKYINDTEHLNIFYYLFQFQKVFRSALVNREKEREKSTGPIKYIRRFMVFLFLSFSLILEYPI